MNKTFTRISYTIIAVFYASSLFAQSNPDKIPIDDNAIFLVIAGAAFGARHLMRKTKRDKPA